MCESRSLPGFPFNIFIELAADMAQLVERTLGKGEVPSSILGISTSELNSLFFFKIKVRSFMPKIPFIFSDNNSNWLS